MHRTSTALRWCTWMVMGRPSPRARSSGLPLRVGISGALVNPDAPPLEHALFWLLPPAGPWSVIRLFGFLPALRRRGQLENGPRLVVKGLAGGQKFGWSVAGGQSLPRVFLVQLPCATLKDVSKAHE